MATPSGVSAPETIKTQKSGLDLTTFSDVKMFKTVTPPSKVTSINEALAHLGNNHEKLLEIVNSGLREAEIEKSRASSEGWVTVDEEGKETPFEGTLIEKDEDVVSVNQLVLALAKNVFGYDDADSISDVDKKRAAKRDSKEQAKEYIRSNEKMLNGLKARLAKSAAK